MNCSKHMPGEKTPVSTPVHQAAAERAVEIREKPLTNSQIAIGIMKGTEALMKANREVGSAVVGKLFKLGGSRRIEFNMRIGERLADVIFVNEDSELDTAACGLYFEIWPSNEGEALEELDVTVNRDKHGVRGYLDGGSVVEVAKRKPRKIAEKLLEGLNSGGIEISAEIGSGEERLQHVTRVIHLPEEEDTPSREEVIKLLGVRALSAFRRVGSENESRAKEARRKIADLANAAFKLGAGYAYKGFVDTGDDFTVHWHQALEIPVFNSMEGTQTLSPVAYLDQPVRTPNGYLLTQVDAFVDKDGLFLYRSGKQGVDWSNKIQPTDEQVLQLQKEVFWKLNDALFQVLPSVRIEVRREQAKRAS